MANEGINSALSALFPMITARLKRAHDIAAAAEACAESSNHEDAVRILLEIDQHTYEVTILLNAMGLIRRERDA